MKNKLMKLISLILCMLMISPLFACDDGNNDESNNPPPEPPKQTYFFDNFINNPKFHCIEKFNDLQDAINYAKSWRKDYEIYIPNIKEASFVEVEITSCSSMEEKEKINHSVKFTIENQNPYYKIIGFTTFYSKGEYERGNFKLEIKERDVTTIVNKYNYFIKEDGNIDFNSETIRQKTYTFGIKHGEHVIEYGSIMTTDMNTFKKEEIKKFILDNIVPVEEQNILEVQTNFSMSNIDIAGPINRRTTYENVYEMERDIIILGKAFDFSCFIFHDNKSACKSEIRIGQDCRIEYQDGYRKGVLFNQAIEYENEKGEIIEIYLVPVIIPNSLIILGNDNVNEYDLITKETESGYEFVVKKEELIVIEGNVIAKEKNLINLQEIEQKLLSNIVLIKG